MSTINVIKIYEARSQVDQKELLRLTEDELTKLRSRSDIVVHVRNTASAATVISVEPEGNPWDWPPEFNAFTVGTENFTLRNPA